MEILSVQPIDRARRIVITELFREVPENVVLAFDRGAICIYDAKTIHFGVARKVDSKNRIIIPKWILGEIPECDTFYLYATNGKYYISPKTEEE